MPNAYDKWIKKRWNVVTSVNCLASIFIIASNTVWVWNWSNLFHWYWSSWYCSCCTYLLDNFMLLLTNFPPVHIASTRKKAQELNGYINQAINLINGSINQPKPNQQCSWYNHSSCMSSTLPAPHYYPGHWERTRLETKPMSIRWIAKHGGFLLVLCLEII